MPITLQINHPDRMIVGVASGTITSVDLDDFAEAMRTANAFQYRKIIDVAAARSGLAADDISAFIERIRPVLGQLRHGPVALVINQANSELARLFASLTDATRPAKTFRSIHDARKWLQEKSLSA
jgi:hypothetical protein